MLSQNGVTSSPKIFAEIFSMAPMTYMVEDSSVKEDLLIEASATFLPGQLTPAAECGDCFSFASASQV